MTIEGFHDLPFRSDCKRIGKAQGGVCLYYKDTFPIKRRTDLELMDESIVVEINLNRKQIIYLLSYRSPSQTPQSNYMGKLIVHF